MTTWIDNVPSELPSDDVAMPNGTRLKVLQMRGAGLAAMPGQSVHLKLSDPALCSVYID